MSNLKKILLCSLFLATNVILSRTLSIRTPIITVSFSFVPIMLTAIMLGWKYSCFVSTMGDLIGALLFPTGSFFIGYTITAFLSGLVYGLILYNKGEFKVDKKFIIKLIISTLIVTGILNGGLNTLWIIITTKNASKIVIPIRILKQLFMAPIKVITMATLCKIFTKRINDFKYD